MWKLGLSPRYSFSGNICFKFSAFCLCSAALWLTWQLRLVCWPGWCCAYQSSHPPPYHPPTRKPKKQLKYFLVFSVILLDFFLGSALCVIFYMGTVGPDYMGLKIALLNRPRWRHSSLIGLEFLDFYLEFLKAVQSSAVSLPGDQNPLIYLLNHGPELW